MNSEYPYRILVVDDEQAVHGLFTSMLASECALEANKAGKICSFSETDGGRATLMEPVAKETSFPDFEISSAFNGMEALEMVRKAQTERRPYTMAFVDMRMPSGWNGIETVVRIWKECFDLQIILCTGYQDFSWHDLIHEFGHSDRLLLLKKPFDLMEVRQVAYSLAEKWDLAHQAQTQMQRLQKLVSERTTKLQEANLSLQRKITENKRAERRLVSQYSVTQALSQASTLTDAVEIIFQIVCRSMDWEWGALWHVDPQANVLRYSNHWHVSELNLETFAAVSRSSIFEPGGDAPGKAWSTGKPIWIRDVFLNSDFRRLTAAAQNGLHGSISFPITAGGKVFGVMEFFSSEVRDAERDMMQSFTVIGSTIGQFIERKQAEEDLRKERDYTAQIIRETPALVIGMSADGTITFVNPSIARNTGYHEEELIGKNWWQLFYPGDEYAQVEQFFRDLEKGAARDYEMVMTTKTGKRTVSWNSLSKHDEAGHLTELIGFGNDITERKLAEAERTSMEVQLRHAQKMESIGHLAAGIAHEINTPTQYIGDNIRFLEGAFSDLGKQQARYEKLVAAAKSNSVTPELLAETEQIDDRENLEFLMKEIPSAVQQSLEGVERVGKIVRAMKDFSHPGTGEKTPIDLNKAIETTLTVAGNEWKYVAKIATDFDRTLPPVPCLPGEFNQVILNLIVNAAHAIADVVTDGSQGLGTITVSTQKVDEWVEIRIRDSGTGIPEKHRGKIFNPFFTTKPVGKGTGQGLAISHAVIVEQHQGQLTFETETGVGTVFIIRLPLNPVRKSV